MDVPAAECPAELPRPPQLIGERSADVKNGSTNVASCAHSWAEKRPEDVKLLDGKYNVNEGYIFISH